MPIVLLHGIGSNAQSFAPLMQAFEGRHPLLAWDAPGYGDSQPLAVDWPDASDYAAALNRLLAQLDVSRCILVGHSLGALIAARFAVVSPTASGRARPDLARARLRRRARRRRCRPRWRAGSRSSTGWAPRNSPPRARPACSPIRPRGRDVLRAVERAMAAVRRPGYDQAARLLAGGRLLDDAAQARRADRGAGRRAGPHHAARECASCSSTRLPGAVAARTLYREIPDAGHAVCQEQPAEVARAIAEIVESKASAHA